MPDNLSIQTICLSSIVKMAIDYMKVVGSNWLAYLAGIIYDVIVEPPSVGSTTDEFGHSKPVSLHKDTDLVTSGVRHSGYFCWTLDIW